MTGLGKHTRLDCALMTRDTDVNDSLSNYKEAFFKKRFITLWRKICCKNVKVAGLLSIKIHIYEWE